MRVYISGPISARIDSVSAADRRSRFYNLEGWLSRQAGVDLVVNPLKVGNGSCDGSCKKTETEERDPQHAWNCYMRYDLIAMLQQCDTICTLPFWHMSPGARVEVLLGVNLGFKVLHATINDQQWDVKSQGYFAVQEFPLPKAVGLGAPITTTKEN
jgi:hypothetical protein